MIATFRSVRIIGVENMSGERSKVMLYPFAGWIGSLRPSERAISCDQAPPARTYCFARDSPFGVRTPVMAPAAESIAWNFGPDPRQVHSVKDVVEAAVRAWGTGAQWRHEPDGAIPESKALVLSSERAARELGWRCAWDFQRSVAASVEWYRAVPGGTAALAALTDRQIADNARDAS